MDDLISRQAAIENSFEVYTKEYGWCEVVGVDVISELPSAQPEIIRCKDCKHKDVENGFCEGRGWPMQLVPDDGFCDKGERRTDE